MTTPAIIIGRGTIGGALWDRLAADPQWDLRYVLTSSKLIMPKNGEGVGRNYDECAFPSDKNPYEEIVQKIGGGVVFLAIPTRDKGEQALKYALAAIQAGAYAVTAEKGMASWQFDKIERWLDKLDLGASVGGGNAFLYTMKRRHLRGKRITIRAVFNATLNNILWQVQGGASLERAVSIASKIGIAEPLKPGESLNPATLINGELQDVVMKICAFFNFVLADGKYLRPDAFDDVRISEDDLARLISVYDRRRFVVTITNEADQEVVYDDGLVGRMDAQSGDYRIQAGFKTIPSGTVVDKWMPDDIDNGILLRENGQTYSYWGPGAGTATVDAMLAGAHELLGDRRSIQSRSSGGNGKQQSG